MKNVFTFCCALCLLALTACGSAPKISEEACLLYTSDAADD